jgi:cell division protein FtsW (lipid II flippase)
MLLASGSTISLVIQAFIIIGGVVKMIPLTGITLPFVSYGGSSMVVSLTILGIMQGVSIKNHKLVMDQDNYEENQNFEEDINADIEDEHDIPDEEP